MSFITTIVSDCLSLHVPYNIHNALHRGWLPSYCCTLSTSTTIWPLPSHFLSSFSRVGWDTPGFMHIIPFYFHLCGWSLCFLWFFLIFDTLSGLFVRLLFCPDHVLTFEYKPSPSNPLNDLSLAMAYDIAFGQSPILLSSHDLNSFLNGDIWCSSTVLVQVRCGRSDPLWLRIMDPTVI